MSQASETPPPALEHLPYRIERLGLTLRFTYAFHAREVRFERDLGSGFDQPFAEIFSFHSERHDPIELYFQLEDLWTKPPLIAPQANRRDGEQVIFRLCQALPSYLERLVSRLEKAEQFPGEKGGPAPPALARVYADVALMLQIFQRFMADKQIDQHEAQRSPLLHMRKLTYTCTRGLVRCRVAADAAAAYVAGKTVPLSPRDDLSESAVAAVFERGDEATVARYALGLAERAFHRWLEDVCLDESHRVFESESSPFASREHEVLAAITEGDGAVLRRGQDFVLFLRRRRNQDCLRVLAKLERFFLRQYETYLAACVLKHANQVRMGLRDKERRLTHFSPRNYAIALVLLLLPFAGAAVAYDRAPLLFDALCSFEVVAINAVLFWFFIWRFCVRHDLTAFRASVPRIAAGIIVGYLPVFLIDEVWDLARRPWFPLCIVIALLGFTTLLYLYVEVQRRLDDLAEAFRRARNLFLIGIFEAFCMGIVLTSLLGRFMVIRNWGAGSAEAASLEALRAQVPAVVGSLPLIVGIEPVLVFPTAILLMTFFSFFVGTFLQLLWEELPITEPL